jgi:hypothetical protein
MMRRLFLVFVLAIVGVSGFAIAAEKGALDGKNYVGESGEVGKTTGDKDELVFADGTFRSTACDQYGFKAVPYTTTQEGDSINFVAHATSEKVVEIHWTGKVTGENCEAKLVWSKAGQKDIEYWFKGTLKR